MHSIKVEDASGRNNNAGDGAEASSSPSENAGVHKVCLPPHRTTFQKLGHRLSEIFFPDDPLHRFKNQTGLRKFVLGLQFFFPIFEWGPKYNLTLLRSDIIAGITIASLSIPQGISYAKLANLPPILGLCKCHYNHSFYFYFLSLSSLKLFFVTAFKKLRLENYIAYICQIYFLYTYVLEMDLTFCGE